MNSLINGLIQFRIGNKREWTALIASLSSLFNKSISLLAIFLYVRWTLPYLGNERFGVWMTLSTIVAFISIFSDFGLGGSLVNYVAYSKAEKSDRSLREFTSSAFFFLSFVAVFFALLLYILSPLIVSSIGNGLKNYNDLTELRTSLFYLFGFFLLSLPFITIDKTLEGLQLMHISSAWAALGNIISLVATYFVTQNFLGIEWLIISTIGVQSVFRVLYFSILFNSRIKFGRPAIKEISTEKTKTLLKAGLLFFVLNVFNVAAFQIDNLIISKQLGIDNVALFSLMQKLVTISFFFWFYTSSLWPAFAEAHAKNDKAWMKKTTIFILRLNTGIGLLFGVFIVLFSSDIISLWTKDLLQPPSLMMKLSFASYIILNGLIGPMAVMFNTGPLLKKHVLGFCIASVTSILLKWFFIKELGVDYLMYLTFLPFLIFYIIPCYIKFKNYVKA